MFYSLSVLQTSQFKKYKSKPQVYPIIHLRSHLTHNLRYRKIVMQKVTKVNSECGKLLISDTALVVTIIT